VPPKVVLECGAGRSRSPLPWHTFTALIWRMGTKTTFICDCCLRETDNNLGVQHAHPVDLRPAHRNHRHRPNAPQLKLRRVTSLSGPTVTSLSGVYIQRRRRAAAGTTRRFVRDRRRWHECSLAIGLITALTVGRERNSSSAA
jgi:hypothetical protein